MIDVVDGGRMMGEIERSLLVARRTRDAKSRTATRADKMKRCVVVIVACGEVSKSRGVPQRLSP